MHGDIQGVGFVFRTWVCDEPWVCACGFLSFALGMLCYVSVFTWSDILRDSTPYHTIPYQTSPIPYQTHSIWSILINHSPLTFSHHISSVAIPIPYHTIPHPPGSPPSAFSFSPPTNHYLTCRDPTLFNPQFHRVDRSGHTEPVVQERRAQHISIVVRSEGGTNAVSRARIR